MLHLSSNILIMEKAVIKLLLFMCLSTNSLIICVISGSVSSDFICITCHFVLLWVPGNLGLDTGCYQFCLFGDWIFLCPYKHSLVACRDVLVAWEQLDPLVSALQGRDLSRAQPGDDSASFSESRHPGLSSLALFWPTGLQPLLPLVFLGAFLWPQVICLCAHTNQLILTCRLEGDTEELWNFSPYSSLISGTLPRNPQPLQPC